MLKKKLYDLNIRLFAAMHKFGDDNEFVRIISECMDLICQLGNISDEEYNEMMDSACELVF